MSPPLHPYGGYASCGCTCAGCVPKRWRNRGGRCRICRERIADGLTVCPHHEAPVAKGDARTSPR